MALTNQKDEYGNIWDDAGFWVGVGANAGQIFKDGQWMTNPNAGNIFGGGDTSGPKMWTGNGPQGYGTYYLDGPGASPGTYIGDPSKASSGGSTTIVNASTGGAKFMTFYGPEGYGTYEVSTGTPILVGAKGSGTGESYPGSGVNSQGVSIYAIPSSKSPTGYVLANGTPVNPDGSPYVGAAETSDADKWTGYGPKGQGTYYLDGPGGTPGTYIGPTTQAGAGVSSSSAGMTPTIKISGVGASNTGGGGSSGGSYFDPIEYALETKARLDRQRQEAELRAQFDRNEVSAEGAASRSFQAGENALDRALRQAEFAATQKVREEAERRQAIKDLESAVSSTDMARLQARRLALGPGTTSANLLQDTPEGFQYNDAAVALLNQIRGNPTSGVGSVGTPGAAPVGPGGAGTVPGVPGTVTPIGDRGPAPVPASAPEQVVVGTNERGAPIYAPAPVAPVAPAETGPVNWLDKLTGNTQETAFGGRVYEVEGGMWTFDGENLMTYDQAMEELRKRSFANGPQTAAQNLQKLLYTDANGVQKMINTNENPYDMTAVNNLFGSVGAQYGVDPKVSEYSPWTPGDQTLPFQFNSLQEMAQAVAPVNKDALDAMAKQNALLGQKMGTSVQTLYPGMPGYQAPGIPPTIDLSGDNIQKELPPDTSIADQTISGGWPPPQALNRGGMVNSGVAVVGEGGGRKPLGSSELLIDPTRDARVVPITSQQAQRYLRGGMPGYAEGTDPRYDRLSGPTDTYVAPPVQQPTTVQPVTTTQPVAQPTVTQPTVQPVSTATPAGSTSPTPSTDSTATPLPSSPTTTAPPPSSVATAPAPVAPITSDGRTAATVPEFDPGNPAALTPEASNLLNLINGPGDPLQDVLDLRNNQPLAAVNPLDVSFLRDAPTYQQSVLEAIKTKTGLPIEDVLAEIRKFGFRGGPKLARVGY